MMGITAGVILPVYNVERTIKRVLDALTPRTLSFVAEILIIDNASEDRTVELIQRCIHERSELAGQISLMVNEQNYGYGCSIKTGFEYFMDRSVSHVMVIHGDYQADPDRLMSSMFAALSLEPSPDLVLASRFTPDSNIANYSLLRTLGNHFFNVATFLCTGYRMSDSGTAMMVVRREILRRIPISNLSNSWQFHPQFNVLLNSDSTIRTKEIPMDWGDSEAKSTVPLFSYGWQLLKMLIGYWAARTILRRPPESAFPSDPIRQDRKFAFAATATKHAG